MTVSIEKECPECGEEMDTSKSYAYGMATGDGYQCLFGNHPPTGSHGARWRVTSIEL